MKQIRIIGFSMGKLQSERRFYSNDDFRISMGIFARIHFWIEEKNYLFWGFGLLLGVIGLIIDYILTESMGYDDEFAFNFSSIPICLSFFCLLPVAALFTTYQLIYEGFGLNKTNSHQATLLKLTQYEPSSLEDDKDDELSVNIANKLIEHSYYDLKKLATDLKIEFDSDYSQEEYGNGSIYESKPWGGMFEEYELDNALHSSFDRFAKSDIDDDLEKLAKKYEITIKEVNNEKYVGQEKCDLIDAVISAQKAGSSKEDIIKRLQKEIEEENLEAMEREKAERKNREKEAQRKRLEKRSKTAKKERFGLMDAVTAAWCPQCNSRMEGSSWGYYCSSCDMRFDKNGGAL